MQLPIQLRSFNKDLRNNSLTRLSGAGAGLHPTTKTIVDALLAAGATVTGPQSKAIDVFVRGEIDAGRWGTSIKRFWLPVWGVAAANAIDWVTLGSGTFVNGATHAAGYVQGNGTSQHFDTGVGMNALGISNATAFISALIVQAETRGDGRHFAGVQNVLTLRLYQVTLNNLIGEHPTTSTSLSMSQSAVGIVSLSTTASNARRLSKRVTSGVSEVLSTANNTGANIADNIFFMGRNVPGFPTIVQWTNARMGAFVLGTGMDAGTTDAFTLAEKTLWETVTGLTLP
jgi:hypothetical protein